MLIGRRPYAAPGPCPATGTCCALTGSRAPSRAVIRDVLATVATPADAVKHAHPARQRGKRSGRSLPQSQPGRPTGDRTVRSKPMTTAIAAELLEQRLAYSVDEAATVTGLSRDLLHDQMRTGKLGYLKIGRRWIITREHLAAFLALRSA